MSVLIKGMEMPKVAGRMEAVITILKDGTAQIAISPADDGIGYWKEYPLIFVPTHGRLIDADKLHEATYHRAFETDGDTMWQSGCWVRYRAVEQVQDSQPTIIEAEV